MWNVNKASRAVLARFNKMQDWRKEKVWWCREGRMPSKFRWPAELTFSSHIYYVPMGIACKCLQMLHSWPFPLNDSSLLVKLKSTVVYTHTLAMKNLPIQYKVHLLMPESSHLNFVDLLNNQYTLDYGLLGSCGLHFLNNLHSDSIWKTISKTHPTINEGTTTLHWK